MPNLTLLFTWLLHNFYHWTIHCTMGIKLKHGGTSTLSKCQTPPPLTHLQLILTNITTWCCPPSHTGHNIEKLHRTSLTYFTIVSKTQPIIKGPLALQPAWRKRNWSCEGWTWSRRCSGGKEYCSFFPPADSSAQVWRGGDMTIGRSALYLPLQYWKVYPNPVSSVSHAEYKKGRIRDCRSITITIPMFNRIWLYPH